MVKVKSTIILPYKPTSQKLYVCVCLCVCVCACGTHVWLWSVPTYNTNQGSKNLLILPYDVVCQNKMRHMIIFFGVQFVLQKYSKYG